MTPHRPGTPEPHTRAADAALRAETSVADQARRTRAFGAGAGKEKRDTDAREDAPAQEALAGDARATGARRGIVLTVSDRCAAGEREDRSGPLASELLAPAGIDAQVRVIPDGADSVRAAIVQALEDGAELIFTTGGTGVGPRDRTPEGTREVLDLELPGLAQAIRDHGALGSPPIPAAVLSRGLAGVVVATEQRPGALIVNAPGSTGGVRDAVAVIGPLLAHVLDQLAGGDH